MTRRRVTYTSPELSAAPTLRLAIAGCAAFLLMLATVALVALLVHA
jgi:hypothetical protein